MRVPTAVLPSGIEEVLNLKMVRAFFRRLNAADTVGLMGFLTERYGMANTLYDTSRQMFLEGQLNWADDTVKVALVDTNAYTPNVAPMSIPTINMQTTLFQWMYISIWQTVFLQALPSAHQSVLQLSVSSRSSLLHLIISFDFFYLSTLISEQYGILRILH